MNIVPLPVVVPLAGAAVILFLNTVLPHRAAQAVTLLFVLAEVALSAALLHQARSGTIVYWFGGWTPRRGVALGISFTVDQIGAGGALLAGIVVAAAVATTRSTIEDAHGIVHALLLTLLAAMAGFCLTGDLFNLFVFFELMAVSAFALAAFHTGSRASLRGALNFAITNSIGAFLVLIGIALLYSRTGALNLAQIGRQLSARGPAGLRAPPGPVDRLTIIAFALLTVGFLIKAAVVPFHFWLVDTASSAPLPLVMVLAGVLDTLGVYAVARVYWTVFAIPVAQHHDAVRAVLVGIGAISAAGGATMALLFREARRRLGFVMVSHTGILLIGVGCLSPAGLAGAGVYAIGDGTVKAALFVGVLLLQGGGAPGVTFSRARRGCGVGLLGIGALALAGLPLFATGLGKAAIEDAASAAGYRWVGSIVIGAAVLSAAAVLDLTWSMARTTTPAPRSAGDLRRGGPWALPFAVGAGLLAVSAAAASMGRWATLATFRFVDTAGYQQRVLGATASAAVASGAIGKVPATIRLSTDGVVVDLLTVVAAVALALGLNREVLVRRRRRQAAPWTRVRVVMARLHDGSIGDSVTWVTVGTAAVALVFAVGLH